jgi:hypothetical protein
MPSPQFGIVMFENGSRNSAMAQAKFASLDAAYASYRAYEGTAKPSLPDYLALTSGQYSGKGTFGGNPSGIDVGTIGFAGPQANIMTQLGTAGFSWKAYEEGVSVNGYNHWGTANDGNYASALYLARHCPAAFYSNTSAAGVSHGNGRYDFDELATDIANSTLPDFFFITPNAVHDGHDSGFGPANTWLNSGGSWGGIDNLIASMRTGGLLAITFDNVPTPDTTVPITGTGIVYLVVAGPSVTHTANSTGSTHFSLLKAIQSFFSVSNFSVGVDSHYSSATAVTLPSTGGGGGGGGGGAGAAPLITVAYNNATPRFVNAAGDQVLLRGVNLTMSSPSSFQNLAAGMGLNCVRLVCNWDRFEATAPTGSGTNYAGYTHTLTASEVATLDSFASFFASQGIYMQIDFHQAGWSPFFGGFSGVPSWYYTDARFKPNQNGGNGWTSADQGQAIAAFWTDTAEKAMAQTLYNAWVKAMVAHVTNQSWCDHVFGWQIFNEPNPGSMGGSSVSKVSTMQTWLSTTVDAIRSIDTSRACFAMCRGGGQGYGTAIFTDAFGSVATMQSKNMAMEYHAYYTGKLPGKNASAVGDVGYAAPGNDDYFPDANTTHNTTAGSSYVGSLAGQRAWLNVPITKAAAIGLPMFHGEFGVHFDDPGRLTYLQHIQTVLDENLLSATHWKLGSTPTDNLGLVTNGNLNDMGLSMKAWFQATNFVIPGPGGGGGPTDLTAPVVNASSIVDGQVVAWTPGTWSGAVTVTDQPQLSADGSTGWTDTA